MAEYINNYIKLDIEFAVLQLSGHMRPMKQSGDLDIPKYWSDWRPKIFYFNLVFQYFMIDFQHLSIFFICVLVYDWVYQ